MAAMEEIEYGGDSENVSRPKWFSVINATGGNIPHYKAKIHLF